MPAAYFLFHPDPRHVRQLRLLLSKVVLLATGDQERAACVSMAGAELVEHLLPYAQGPFSLAVNEGQHRGDIRFDLVVKMAPGPLQELRSAVDDIRATDPFDTYTRELVNCQEEEGVSLQFRLARILLENGMAIRCEPLENDRVRLRAVPSSRRGRRIGPAMRVEQPTYLTPH